MNELEEIARRHIAPDTDFKDVYLKVLELLEREEKEDTFNLTTWDRRVFQQAVEDCMLLAIEMRDKIWVM